ncbi:F-actin-capping protein [Lobaria immixta]|nr:F-actin-capping protein [Lobaria immixta]
MTSANAAAVSAFVEGAPPGELADVVADIKALTPDDPALLELVKPAFEKYNEEQLTTVKLPGSGKYVSRHRGQVLVSSYNSIGGGRYYDVENQSSFAFDHTTQKASAVQSYSLDSQHIDLMNGRFRTTYHFTPATASLSGTLKCDVHYYEDGNVRLTTSKTLASTAVSSSPSASSSSALAIAITKTIAATEHKYHDELNRGFTKLSEGEFKALRRQLPVTRQKVEWEKIGGYRLGQDIGGGRVR